MSKLLVHNDIFIFLFSNNITNLKLKLQLKFNKISTFILILKLFFKSK